MSVQSQIERISAAVADSYTAAADIGATIPQTQTVDNLPETIRSIPTGGIKLDSIAVTTPPAKTSYLSGERFDPAGMVVTATYSNGAKLAATGYAIEPSGPLSDGMTSVTIRYTEGGVSCTAIQPITVIRRLESIAVTTPPNKTVYEYGDAFSKSGMVVKATYSDGAVEIVSSYTCSPSTFTMIGGQNVTVSYTERGVTKTTLTPVTVERKRISAVPSQSGSLTYSGSALTPSWINYDPEQLTIGGTTSATNAGTYTATFTPISNYEWSDGTTAAKSVSWTIGKAAGSLSISPTSLTLNTSNPTGKITVTRAGNGTITAESSNTGIVTVSVSGNEVTVNNVNQMSGSATVTVKVSAGTNHTAPGNKTCEITAAFVSSVLNDNYWATIRQVSDNGQGANYWSIGDRKAVTLNGTMSKLTLSNFTTYAFIIGFNHNASVEGSNRIHFQIGKTALSGGTDVCLVSGYDNDSDFYMNNSNTNSGGWNNSYMRKTILGTILSSYSGTFIGVLPAALRAVLKSVTKYTDNTGGASTAASAVTATTDYAFLLSEYEVFGSISRANSNEASKQAQYDYYKAGNSKVKYNHSATSTAVDWWLRSPSARNSSGFVIAGYDGTVDAGSASYSRGVAPGFCV